MSPLDRIAIAPHAVLDFEARGIHLMLMQPRAALDPQAQAIVADLTHDASARIAGLAARQAPVLAFYSHVESEVREQALAAGFELVVPRSRIAREGPALLDGLLATAR